MKFLFVLILFFSSSCFSQDYLSTPKDSVKHHSVKRAVILSAIIPGAGQIYNHTAMPKGKKNAFWKVPLIYAGLGTTAYFVITNNSLKNELKKEYSLRENGDVGDDKWNLYDDQGVLTLYDQYLSFRDLSILAVGLVYIFQVADAGVEAHFVDFDVSEDLSFTIDPTMINYNTAGLSMKLNFR